MKFVFNYGREIFIESEYIGKKVLENFSKKKKEMSLVNFYNFEVVFTPLKLPSGGLLSL
jgi:hypothetical protein